MLVARWETRGKKYWYELHLDPKWGFHFTGDSSHGSASPDGAVTFDEPSALAYMERMVNSANRNGHKSMKRV